MYIVIMYDIWTIYEPAAYYKVNGVFPLENTIYQERMNYRNGRKQLRRKQATGSVVPISVMWMHWVWICPDTRA